MSSAQRTILFVNVAHAIVHYLMLIYPTAVLAIVVQTGITYDRLIPLATGGLVAYGLLSVPAGWLADKVGRRPLLALFFIGAGVASIGVAATEPSRGIAYSLLALGALCAIYHPVGLSLLVSNSRRLGRDLGVNGVCGNLGAAIAAACTAVLTAAIDWRAAFIVPGVVSILCGVLYLLLSSDSGTREVGDSPEEEVIPVARPSFAIAAAVTAILAGGMTYTILTVALPRIIDERLGAELSLERTGLLATAVLICGAATQLVVGRLIDRMALPTLFVVLAGAQLAGLLVAALSTGPLMLAGLALTMAAIYGEVIVDDALVARFVPAPLRGKAYGLSYCLGFATAGVAAPLIGLLHTEGFGVLLALTAGCGAILFLCALGFPLAIGPAKSGADPVSQTSA